MKTANTLPNSIALINSVLNGTKFYLNGTEDVLTNKLAQRAVLEALDKSYRNRYQNRDCYEAVKSATSDLFYNKLRTEFDSIVFTDISEDDTLALARGEGPMNTAEYNISNALDWMHTAALRVEMIYEGFSIYLFGENSKMKLSHPKVKVSTLPDLGGVSARVDASEVSVSNVDIPALFRPTAWKVMHRRINEMTSVEKPTAAKAWQRLNAEIATLSYKFGEINKETISKDGFNLTVTTSGYGTAILNYLEESEFKRLNPVNDRGEEQTPYAYDVRDTAEKIAAVREEMDRLEQLEHFRKEHFAIMWSLFDNIQQPNSDIRAVEARKASRRPNFDGVWFRAPKELATNEFKVGEEVVYVAYFEEFYSKEAIEFLRERSKLDAVERAAEKDRNEQLRKNKVLKDFGLL